VQRNLDNYLKNCDNNHIWSGSDMEITCLCPQSKERSLCLEFCEKKMGYLYFFVFTDEKIGCQHNYALFFAVVDSGGIVFDCIYNLRCLLHPQNYRASFQNTNAAQSGTVREDPGG